VDKVRVYWTQSPGGYDAYVEAGEGDRLPVIHLFRSTDRDEFFRRYDAITLEKEESKRE
jgi:hypothetical protein